MQVFAKTGFNCTEDFPVKLRLNHIISLQPDLFTQAILKKKKKICKGSKKKIKIKKRKPETKLVLDVDV